MKRYVVVLVFVFCVLVFSAVFTSASSNTDYDDQSRFLDDYYIEKIHMECIPCERGNSISVLPLSLINIEDEAFEGTAIKGIVLPDALISIGDRSFAGIKTLRFARIPMTTTSIAKTAFAGSNNVMITAAPNSYARTWAKENKLPFSSLTVMYASTGSQNITGYLSSVSKEIFDMELSETEDTNRTWRKLEEIQVNDIIEIIANIIKSRAPPMA